MTGSRDTTTGMKIQTLLSHLAISVPFSWDTDHCNARATALFLHYKCLVWDPCQIKNQYLNSLTLFSSSLLLWCVFLNYKSKSIITDSLSSWKPGCKCFAFQIQTQILLYSELVQSDLLISTGFSNFLFPWNVGNMSTSRTSGDHQSSFPVDHGCQCTTHRV